MSNLKSSNLLTTTPRRPPSLPMKTLVLSLLFPLLHAADKPCNIVFILVDDLGVTDVNLDGSDPFYETPNLAKTAVNFTNGYSSCPVCSPTRSAIMTGQNPARTRNTDFFDLEADPGETKNLADEQPEITGDLTNRIKNFLGATNALQPHRNPDLQGEFTKW